MHILYMHIYTQVLCYNASYYITMLIYYITLYNSMLYYPAT